MPASTIAYFGFGSLVNRETRPLNEACVRATLYGWRRHWAHRSVGFPPNPIGSEFGTTDPVPTQRHSCCSLTVQPMKTPVLDPEVLGIDGVLVTIPHSALAELDRRESGYDRVQIEPEQIAFAFDSHALSVERLFMYVSKTEFNAPADEDHPILQSYIDCVMAGYEAQFGADGLSRFLQTTHGWRGPIENDRSSPRYPRAVQLSVDQQARYDALLKETRSELR